MWTKELFGVEKPIIALVHLHALPVIRAMAETWMM
jgi:predicted TIM-barrel enzyme